MLSENQRLERAIKERNELIDALEEKTIDREEFHQLNMQNIVRRNMKPFLEIDNLDKGIYNYQYYNTLIKDYLEQRKYINNPRIKKDLNGQIRNLYDLKDQTILDMLNFGTSDSVIAYRIKTDSRHMENLLEIFFKNEEKMILHTLSKEVYAKVVKMKMYDKNIRESMINSYINYKKEGEDYVNS